VYAVKGHGMPGLRETMKPKFYTSASCYVIQTLTLVTLCLIQRRVAWISSPSVNLLIASKFIDYLLSILPARCVHSVTKLVDKCAT